MGLKRPLVGGGSNSPDDPNTPRASGVRGAGAISLAFALDALFAEPPHWVHPVALFGRFVTPIDREWRFPRLVGLLASACLPLAAAGVAAGAVVAADRRSASFPLADRERRRGVIAVGQDSIPFTTLVAGGVLFSTTSRRMLTDTARSVVADSEHDLPRARRDLRALAGRDSGDLSPGEIRGAAVESVGENLADGLVAPLLVFSIFAPLSLPAAAGATAWVKAVNTMDSMLGYHSIPTGWAPARLDDLVMWVPARLSALLLALAAADPTALREASAWAREPPSPNSGWPMATLATVLDVRLEKPGVYVLNPSEELPTEAEATAGIDIVSRAGVLATLLALVAVVVADELVSQSQPLSRLSGWIEWS